MKLFAIPFVKRYSPGVIAFLSQLHCFIFCQVILLQPVFDVLQNSKYCTWFLCLVSTIKWRGGLPSSAVVPQIYALHGSFWDLVTWSLVQTFLGKAAGEAPAWVVTGPFFKGFFFGTCFFGKLSSWPFHLCNHAQFTDWLSLLHCWLLLLPVCLPSSLERKALQFLWPKYFLLARNFLQAFLLPRSCWKVLLQPGGC